MRPRGAVAAISRQEIAWAAEQTECLVKELVQMDANLQALRRLKATLDLLPAGAPGEGGRGRVVP